MKTIFCYIYPDMADFEVVVLLHRLRNAGKRRVLAIAETMDMLTAQSGLHYQPDMTIEEAMNMEAEALIIPGGPINNKQNAILPLIRQLHCQGKLVAAICFGPQFLGRAGILAGKQFTTSCSAEHIVRLGVTDPFPRETYVNQRAVRDGTIITAQGHAFVDFAIEVCRYLQVFDTPQQEYDQLGKIKSDE